MKIHAAVKTRTDRVYHSPQRKTQRMLVQLWRKPMPATIGLLDPPGLTLLYVLEGKTPRLARSMAEHASQFEQFSKSSGKEVWRVAETELPNGRVSTVFLGFDHNWYPEGPPILFETMVFLNNDDSQEQRRYATWEQAEAGHAEAVARHMHAANAVKKLQGDL
jgi:hypothetical protein